jgi:hypothetical protein
LAPPRLRVAALRVFEREAAREAVPLRDVFFLPRPETADVTALALDVTALAPRRARLALLRAALRTGSVTTSKLSVADRFLLRLSMPNMFPRDGLLIGVHAKRLQLCRGSVMLRRGLMITLGKSLVKAGS